jgi:PadR family transcriptional regulator, regulatory protein PadR
MRNLKPPSLPTVLEEAIMLSILHQPRFGQNIVEVVSAASCGSWQISCGTLYPALQRLKKRGLIKTETLEADLVIRRGHNRCYYSVTQRGRSILEELEDMRSQIRKYTELSV